MVDIAKGPAEAFGPLKAVLESVSVLCEKYQVRLIVPFEDIRRQSHLQNTAAVKDKIEVLLSRVAALEKLFKQPAGDEKEIKRREGMSMYVIRLCSERILISALVNSRASKRNCRRWAGSPCLYGTSIVLKTVKMSVDFLKTYRRSSTTTWSVHCHHTPLDIDHDNRWCNKWQSMTKVASSWYVSLLFMSE